MKAATYMYQPEITGTRKHQEWLYFVNFMKILKTVLVLKLTSK